MLDVKQWGEKKIETKDDTYRTLLLAGHCEMTKRKKKHGGDLCPAHVVSI